jgi:hypothetical protein
MGEVVNLPVVTTLDLDPDRVLGDVLGKLDGFILAGVGKDGHEMFRSTFGDKAEALWYLERCRLALLSVSVEE